MQESQLKIKLNIDTKVNYKRKEKTCFLFEHLHCFKVHKTKVPVC